MSAAGGHGWLPPLYRDIAEAAGLEATLALAAARGGQRVYVPLDPRIAPWLVQAMGEAGAAALVRLYGGEAIVLPVNPRGGQRERVRAIREALTTESANTVAARFGMSKRQMHWNRARVRAIEKAGRKRGPQLDLFEPRK